MKIGLKASQITGISDKHARLGFQKIADQWHSVIMSRAVGKACLGPIREGYASKSFHVKAKSCDWGPMAGFLLEDKRLTKRKKAEWDKQKSDIVEPFKEKYCTFTPLLISKDRVKYLLDNHYIKPIEPQITSKNLPNRINLTTQSPDNERFDFTIVKRPQIKETKSGNAMWGVYFSDSIPLDQIDQLTKDKDATGLVPVTAIVNAKGKIPDEGNLPAVLVKRYEADSGWVKGYRGACTGDYDLFAILPSTTRMAKAKRQPGWIGNIPFEMNGVDIRPVKLGIRFDPDLEDDKEKEADKKKVNKKLGGEHPDLGNITARIYMIRDNLNEAFQKADKWTDRIMVHHSDEGGRPFWPELDYPLHAFVPNEDKHIALENSKDLIAFFKRIDKLGYKIVIPPNWEKELGLKQIHLNYTVPKWSKKQRKRADVVRKPKRNLAHQHSVDSVMLNGMKVIFDKAISTTPVNLVPNNSDDTRMKRTTRR